MPGTRSSVASAQGLAGATPDFDGSPRVSGPTEGVERIEGSRRADGSASTRTLVLKRLDDLGVPEEIRESFPDLPADLRALMVYGSRARGDAVPTSDLDALGLTNSSRSTRSSGLTNLSFYTVSELRSGIGTLFGEHLRRDGRILFDPDGDLAEVLEGMDRVDTRRVFERSLAMAALFTTLDADIPKYLFGLTRAARYLLRSSLYAKTIAEGKMCFSVRELAERYDEPALVELLASRPAMEPTLEDLQECTSRLATLVGDFPVNPHGSLESTVVNEWDRPGDILSMAFMALGSAGDGLSDYAEVGKILL